MRIGIDIGGVIIAQDTDEPDLFFSENFLRAKPFPNCFETIQALVEKYGEENIFIISKCGPVVQKKTTQWLEDKNFFSFTKFKRENINFCLERYEKAGIAERLNLNIFIDDRFSVLKYLLPLKQIEKLILFCPNDIEKELSANNPNDLILPLGSWIEVSKVLEL